MTSANQRNLRLRLHLQQTDNFAFTILTDNDFFTRADIDMTKWLDIKQIDHKIR